jgi:hypothetical protein
MLQCDQTKFLPTVFARGILEHSMLFRNDKELKEESAWQVQVIMLNTDEAS